MKTLFLYEAPEKTFKGRSAAQTIIPLELPEPQKKLPVAVLMGKYIFLIYAQIIFLLNRKRLLINSVRIYAH